jgi:hypothetical protein
VTSAVVPSRTAPSRLAELAEHILIRVNSLCLRTEYQSGTQVTELGDAQVTLQGLSRNVAFRELAGSALALQLLIQIVRDKKGKGSHGSQGNTTAIPSSMPRALTTWL